MNFYLIFTTDDGEPMLFPSGGRGEHKISVYPRTLRYEPANAKDLVVRFDNPLGAWHGEVPDGGGVNVIFLSSESLKLFAFILRHVEAYFDEIEQQGVRVNLDHP